MVTEQSWPACRTRTHPRARRSHRPSERWGFVVRGARQGWDHGVADQSEQTCGICRGCPPTPEPFDHEGCPGDNCRRAEAPGYGDDHVLGADYDGFGCTELQAAGVPRPSQGGVEVEQASHPGTLLDQEMTCGAGNLGMVLARQELDWLIHQTEDPP